MALIVLLPDLAGMGLYYLGLRGTSASIAMLAELCYPLTSLALGLTVLGSAIGWGQLTGLALLLTAVFALGRAPNIVQGTKGVYVSAPAVS